MSHERLYYDQCDRSFWSQTIVTKAIVAMIRNGQQRVRPDYSWDCDISKQRHVTSASSSIITYSDRTSGVEQCHAPRGSITNAVVCAVLSAFAKAASHCREIR